MGVNENRQSGLDEAVQIGSTAAKVVEGAAKAGKITVAAANGTALGGPYGAAASAAIAAAKHGKKILLALLAILAIPLLFLVMLPTLIFGGTAQTTGDTTILNDQAAITENMNEIAFAVSDLLGSGIADAEQRIADDFAASSADQYEIVNPYEDERINNVNLFISQYCAYRDTDVAAISLEDMKQLLRSGIGELYDYTYEDEMREVEETALNEDGEEVTALREVTVRVYTLTYRGEAYFADSIFHLTAEQKTLAQNFAENLSLFLGDGLFQNLSSSESNFTIPALGNIRYTDGGTEVVYYNQLDERYANKPYGTDNIGGYGCGPTATATRRLSFVRPAASMASTRKTGQRSSTSAPGIPPATLMYRRTRRPVCRWERLQTNHYDKNGCRHIGPSTSFGRKVSCANRMLTHGCASGSASRKRTHILPTSRSIAATRSYRSAKNF